MKKVLFVAISTVVLVLAGTLFMSTAGLFANSAKGANGPQDQETTSVQGTAEHGEAAVGPAREVVLNAVPQVAPRVGPPREIPDHPEAGEMEGYQNKPIPGATGQSSPMPQIGAQQQTPGASVFTGEGEVACDNYIPSDHALATSSSYVVQVLNDCITVYNTSGSVFSGFPKSLNTFFGAPSGNAVGDPRALFDWRLSRFIVVAEDFTAHNLLLAVSETSTPTGAWWAYTLSGTVNGQLPGSPDFPMLGQTEQENGDADGGIYLSYDRFNTSGNFQDNVVWILPKTPIYAGNAFSFHYFSNLTLNGKTVDHVQPANVMSRQDRPRAELLINTLDFNFGCTSSSPCKGLVLWSIYDGVPPSGSSPTLSGKLINTTNSYIYPVTATQKGATSGTKCAINTGNAGISSTVHWSAGDLYVAASTAAHNGQATDGWIYWQVHPYLTNNSSGAAVLASTAGTIRNEICWGCNGFTGNSTFSEYYPAVQPDDEGNVSVVYNFSSASNYPSTGYVSLRTTQPTGAFPDGGLSLANGQSEYCQIDSVGRNRWGDYTASSPFGTPVATLPTFWFAGQHSDSSGRWATNFGQNGFTSDVQP